MQSNRFKPIMVENQKETKLGLIEKITESIGYVTRTDV